MPPPHTHRVIAVANQKGGVGKTATAISLAAALGELNYRVLLVDMDPQASATLSIGCDYRDLDLAIYDALLGDTPLNAILYPTSARNVTLAPSTPDLAGAEVELVPKARREHFLAAALAPLLAGYDAIIIDCPPSLGLLTINALTAATGVLIPVQCEFLALEGLSQLLNSIELMRKRLNPSLTVLGVLMTMYSARTRLAQDVVREARANLSVPVYQAVIPRSVRVSEAPSYGHSILTYDATSPAAVAYRRLAQEVLEHA